jgi:hypothetical protein
MPIGSTGLTSAARPVPVLWRGGWPSTDGSKGHAVAVEIVPLHVLDRKGQRETLWNVRTDLRAGLPPRAT